MTKDILTLMACEFKVGKLYVCSNKGQNSIYNGTSGKLRIYPAQMKSGNIHYMNYCEFSMDDPILILEMLYIKSTKTSHISENTFTVYNTWHAKILVNEMIGYVFISEADWTPLC